MIYGESEKYSFDCKSKVSATNSSFLIVVFFSDTPSPVFTVFAQPPAFSSPK